MRRHPRAGRRRWLIMAVVGAAMLALAGCTDLPEGVDGDITGDWDQLPEPVSFTPQTQVCHPEQYPPFLPVEQYQPIDCDQLHQLETVHVGEFTGDAAELEAPPAEDSQERRAAFGQCEEEAEQYLGAGFRHGPLRMTVTVPTEEAWQSGARWYQCDVSELAAVAGEPVLREGSLADALQDGSELRLGCFAVNVGDDDLVQERTPVACDEPHQAEFVGTWSAPDGPYPDADEGGDSVEEVYNGCRSRIASFTGVPDDGDVRYRIGAIADWMSESDWYAGDQAFRCYLWTGEEVAESLRDAGTDALPVQTE